MKPTHAGRVPALEALEKIKDISTKVVTHTDDDISAELIGKDMARRYFGCVCETLAEYGAEKIGPEPILRFRLRTNSPIYKIRDWRTNQDAINKMRGEIDDILFDVAEQHGLDLSLDDHDAIIDRCIEVAIANED